VVTNNRSDNRYELEEGGATAIAAYRIEEGRITFNHTVVPEELEGKGVGSRLIAGALEQVREEGLKVVPACSFVRHYVDTHPDTQDLLA
jgi:hypothetical protein